MGWSCTILASNVLDKWEYACRQSTGFQNAYITRGGRYYYDVSRTEHRSGAITGEIWKYLPDSAHARKVGTFRIEVDGTVSRAPAFLKKAAAVQLPKHPFTAEFPQDFHGSKEKD